ncbi:MAG TPA: DoxX family protein [Myxococcota bacterium]|nr:DoxX family protein [Myxococcota bacterium]
MSPTQEPVSSPESVSDRTRRPSERGPEGSGRRARTETTAWRWTRYGLVGLFLFAGGGKLLGLEAMRQTFEHFGYGEGFRLLIGLLELAGAGGLLIPGLVPFAALGLSGIMIGAIGSHLIHDPVYMALPALVVLLGLLGVVWRRPPASLLDPEAEEAGVEDRG